MSDRTLTDADVDAIATRLIELGREDRLLTTAAAAELLSVSDDWLRDRAGELGAIRLGGSRGPLRFERRALLRAVERDGIPQPPRHRRRRPGPTRRIPGVDGLLPIP